VPINPRRRADWEKDAWGVASRRMKDDYVTWTPLRRSNELAHRQERERARRIIRLGGTLGVVLGGVQTTVALIIATSAFPKLGNLEASFVGGGIALVFGIGGARAAAGLLTRTLARGDELQAVYEQRLEEDAARRAYETRLTSAFDMANGEPEVLDAARRALQVTLGAAPAEVLLADNSHAHLEPALVTVPEDQAPGCPVESPAECPAARRAQVQYFDDSEALDACPKLRDRPQGRCSAICVPVSVMGRTVGVIHTLVPPNQVVEPSRLEELRILSHQLGGRLGMLRVMAETELQALTDGLTGLFNRRAFQNKLRELRLAGVPISIAMSDLDHFKQLNDTYGHDAGDIALRTFARTVKAHLRDRDFACRYGGEEFAIAMPHTSLDDAVQMIETLRINLAGGLRTSGVPMFTSSFGVVEMDHGEMLEDALRRADVALFEAKHAGRDRIVAPRLDSHAAVPTIVSPNGTNEGDSDQEAAANL